MTARRIAACGALFALVGVAGCHGKGPDQAPAGAGGAPAAVASSPPPPPAPAAGGGGPIQAEAVVSAIKGAGLAAEGFAPLTPVPFGAARCEEGRVETIDTIVCEYRDPAALAQGKSALLQQWGREGGHTGLALASRLTLLGLVDRAHHDPNGKTISRVVDTFRKM